MKKILIVDDDPEIRANLTEIFNDAGYEAMTVASGQEAIDMAVNEQFDVILLDLIMPKMSGIDVLVELRKVTPWSRVIILTAFATRDNAIEAIKKGASDFIYKPFKIEELLIKVRQVIEEASFETPDSSPELDFILGSLSNVTRRKIIRLLHLKKTMRLTEIAKELGIEDHAKVLFHLQLLKRAKLIEQSQQKVYSLTIEGEKLNEYLKLLERYLKRPTG